MIKKSLLTFSLVLGFGLAANSYANPVEGKWLGICVVNNDKDGKFENSSILSYEFTKIDDKKIGILKQGEDIFTDEACKEGKTTDNKEFTYTIGEAKDSIYPLNVILKLDDETKTFYDIAKQTKEGEVVTLYLGKDYSSEEAKRPTELSEKDRVYTMIKTNGYR